MKRKVHLTIQNGTGEEIVLDAGQGTEPIRTVEALLATNQLRITSNNVTNGNMDFGDVIPITIVCTDEGDENCDTRIKLFYGGVIKPYSFTNVKSLYDFFLGPESMQIAQPPIKAEVYFPKCDTCEEVEEVESNM